MQIAYPYCLIKRFRLGVCRCGKSIPLISQYKTLRKYCHGHNESGARRKYPIIKIVECACGCKEKIKTPVWSGCQYEDRRYIQGHQRRGIKHTEYSKKKMSVSQRKIGRIPWNKNKHYKFKNKRHYSDEGRKKLSEAAKRSYQNGRVRITKGHPNKLKGKKMNEQQKKNYFGRKHSKEAKLKMSLARANITIPKHDTIIEKTIQNELTKLEIPFKKHKRFHINNFIHPVDIFIPPNICIECDGDYWHTQLIGRRYKNYLPIKRDCIIDIELEKQGMKVIRLWEYDIKNNLDWCMRLITSIRKR